MHPHPSSSALVLFLFDRFSLILLLSSRLAEFGSFSCTTIVTTASAPFSYFQLPLWLGNVSISSTFRSFSFFLVCVY